MEYSRDFEFNSKPVSGYEGYYEVNKSSEIKSLHNKNGNLLKPRIDRGGYVTVRLSKEGESKTHYVHRIGAIAFVPNPEKKPFVNHINGNKLDNRIVNLEWSTHSENVQHAYNNYLIKPKCKLVFDLWSGMIFLNARQAAGYYDLKHNTVRNYLNGGINYNPTGLMYLSNFHASSYK